MRRPKPVTARDEDYLNWIRAQPCAVCVRGQRSDPHHLESGVMGATGSDYFALPMCRGCHRELHTMTLRKFEAAHRINMYREALRHLERYINEEKPCFSTPKAST